MAMAKRYQGSFLDIASNVWAVEIWLDSAAEYDSSARELIFAGDEPLVIEWPETAKHDVVCGSTATLRIESPGDRSYFNMASLYDCQARMDVYRNDSLFWSGTIDPEFYEEPYEKAQNYDIELSFSDFGVLDRQKYDLEGRQSIGTLMAEALSRCGMLAQSIDWSLCTTRFGRNTPVYSAMVDSANFYDEDGEASTWKEVLEGVLQPLAVRIVQRLGKWWAYDINGLATLADVRAVNWSGDSQILSMDPTYKTLKVTWSTYCRDQELQELDCWGDEPETDAELTNRNTHSANSNASSLGAQYYTYPQDTDAEDWLGSANDGFTLWLKDDAEGATLADGVKAAKTVAQAGGADQECVAICYGTFVGDNGRAAGTTIGQSDPVISVEYERKGINPASVVAPPQCTATSALVKTYESELPVANDGSLRLCVSMEALFGSSANPFDSSEPETIGDNLLLHAYDCWRGCCNYFYLPVAILFKSDATGKTYVWRNLSPLTASKVSRQSYSGTVGSWKEWGGYPCTVPGYLSWYEQSLLASDEDYPKSTCANNGFQGNRQAVSPLVCKVDARLGRMGTGQRIPYPPAAPGKLWIEILNNGVCMGKHKVAMQNSQWSVVDSTLDTSQRYARSNFPYVTMHWLLVTLPKVTIEKDAVYDTDLDTDDVEYSFALDGNAAEELSIDTVCGTAEGGVPTARGAYLDPTDCSQVTEFARAGRTAQAEELIGGTIYSQYASRKVKLSGEADLDAGSLCAYSEQNQSGKAFMKVAETMDCRMGCGDVAIVEIRPDEYDREEGES